MITVTAPWPPPGRQSKPNPKRARESKLCLDASPAAATHRRCMHHMLQQRGCCTMMFEHSPGVWQNCLVDPVANLRPGAGRLLSLSTVAAKRRCRFQSHRKRRPQHTAEVFTACEMAGDLTCQLTVVRCPAAHSTKHAALGRSPLHVALHPLQHTTPLPRDLAPVARHGSISQSTNRLTTTASVAAGAGLRRYEQRQSANRVQTSEYRSYTKPMPSDTDNHLSRRWWLCTLGGRLASGSRCGGVTPQSMCRQRKQDAWDAPGRHSQSRGWPAAPAN